MNQRIQKHYSNIAHNYDALWTYNPDFIKFVAKNIIEKLELQVNDKLVDLGCGTGLFTKGICKQMQLKYPILCVDSSSEMLKQIPVNHSYEPIFMDAVEFSSKANNLDKILLKEMIHHVPDKNKLIANLFNSLNPGGIFLLILLPPTIEYPLFELAKKTYEEVQPHYKTIETIFKDVGFKTEVSFVSYPLSIDKVRYFSMVKNRYMSLLSRFTDGEIQEGLEEMSAKYLSQSTLDFNDTFVFMVGKK
ncbi:MAG: class I SAM-dependent methyltransferase [Xenococcaceae cyanobacterium MO_167.B52]|nr:class I SAM-dependent methyltransferase [Xenococcaceae cyanobacterium MO_167.B52]